ncbi:class B sortase [Bacillus sonorensis]|uniref:class B sortase n=1 Tax=Bacillus TaxID=1386 RepID=UPI001B01AC0E|nr:class B sortase [Bacillus sonorensis]MCY8088104.1 class B sortase [Bacillus sonorensis]MEC1355333.1 class B sortase [Bacillus sonorensis]MEC1426888.1 class B sortase [Bacillus sonorensis]MEC1438911.1 class B sortase [Bacillus sonorensis]MEC1502846.1 class B sortase [Bacillus sonorensis]
MKRTGTDQKKKSSPFQRLLTVICLCVLIYSGWQLAGELFGYYQNRKVLAEAQTMFDRNAAKAENKRGIRPQFDQLRKVNRDIVGWIELKDTMINYPIVQAADNDFYLFRNYKKADTKAGSIFMDYRNSVKNESPNTVIYGHRMKDGSMFAQLTKYLKKDFFEAHRTFHYDTLYKSYEAEIFAVYNTTVDFDYIQTDFQDLGEYAQFLHQVKNKSIYQTDTDVSTDDLILTLSTCDYFLSSETGRLVVQAKLKEVT